MTETTTTSFLINAIVIGKRARVQVDDVYLDELAESIRLIGLLHPIILDGPHLIAGWCRLQAHIRLGRTYILARHFNDLEPWERLTIEYEENARHKDIHWADEKVFKLRIHEEYVKQHGKRQTLGGESKVDVWRLEDTAQHLGISLGKASKDLELAQALRKDPDLAKHKTETEALGSLRRTTAQQIRVITAAAQIMAAPKTVETGIDPAVPGADESIGTAFVKPGTQTLAPVDQFERGDSRLILGDAVSLISTLPDHSVHSLLTDPPWKVEFDRTFGTDPSDVIGLISGMLEGLKAKLVPGALCWMFCATKNLISGLVKELIHDHGYTMAEQIFLWTKPGVGNVHRPYKDIKNDYEPCVLFWRKTRSDFTTALSAVNHCYIVGERVHPAQKPVEILQKLIVASTVKGELVLDPFCGSGQTLVAAQQLGRRSVGIECETEHFMTAVTELSKCDIRKET